MKLQPRPRSSRARAQLSNQLLAYSATTAATLGAASTAKAQITLDAAYFGGTLPSISFSTTDSHSLNTLFSIGNGQLRFLGSHHFHTETSAGETSSVYSGNFQIMNVSGFANLKLNSSSLTQGAQKFVFSTSYGRVNSNIFYGNSRHTTNLVFTTSAGGDGILPLKLEWGGGNISLSVADGGTFTAATAIPEPANVACGLGLVALGFAGIREHRRRRTAAAAKKSPASA